MLTGIGIGDGQGARGHLQCTAVFRHIAGIHTTDYGCIIGTCNGDNDVMGGTVNGGDLHSIGRGGAQGQCLYVRMGIIERVGPVAVCIDG